MSPDLIVIVRSAELTRDRAAAIAKSLWPADSLQVGSLPPSRSQASEGIGAISIGAHDILDDQADWNSPEWLFDPVALHRLAITIRRLFELLPEQFTLLAAWAGEQPIRELNLTRDELVAIIDQNRLGNRILYRVARA